MPSKPATPHQPAPRGTKRPTQAPQPPASALSPRAGSPGRKRTDAPKRKRGGQPDNKQHTPMPPKQTAKRRGGQPGNKNARTHGQYAAPAGPLTTIDDVLADLAGKQARLSAILDTADLDDTENLVKLFGIHAANASRLGRLLRDQRALSGAAADGIAGAIAQALDEISSELGQPL